MKRCRDFTGAQFDHMTLRIDGKTFKDFRVVCLLTRRQCAKVFSNATVRITRAFPREVAERHPRRAGGRRLSARRVSREAWKFGN